MNFETRSKEAGVRKWRVMGMTNDMTIIGEEAYRAAKELLTAANLREGQILVVGCSTSWQKRCSEAFIRLHRKQGYIWRLNAVSI